MTTEHEDITADAMRSVMRARGWTLGDVYTTPSGLAYEVWDHATARRESPCGFRNVLLPTRRMGDGSDAGRVRSWAEATAGRHGDTTADAVLAEARAAAEAP